jgi:hypothetical protein
MIYNTARHLRAPSVALFPTQPTLDIGWRHSPRDEASGPQEAARRIAAALGPSRLCES